MTRKQQPWLSRHLHRSIYAREREQGSKSVNMHSAKQKVKDAAAVAAEHAEILKAKADEKAAKVVARTEEEKEIAHELRKAKEAEAKMKMHEAKAEHTEEKLYGKLHHGVPGHHGPIGAGAPAGAVAPAASDYPHTTHPPGTGYGAADYK